MRRIKFRIYVAIADTVRDVIDSGAQHTLGIIQHDDVHRGSISMLVRFVNHRPVGLGTHFWTRAAKIINPHFCDVGFVLNQFVDALAGFFRSRYRDGPRDGGGVLDRACDVQARYRARSSLVAVLSYRKFFVPTQTEDGGDSITQIDSELFLPVDMAVRIDQAGNDGLPRGIDSFRSRRELDVFSDRRDVAILYHQGRVFDCRLTGTIDDAWSHPGLHAVRGTPTFRCLPSDGEAERHKKEDS